MHLSIPARGVLAALPSLSFIRRGVGAFALAGAPRRRTATCSVSPKKTLREASPGLLDRLSPQAQRRRGGRQGAHRSGKTAGFFTVAGVPAAPTTA